MRWEEARELAGPLRLEAAARLPPPPPALVLARELGGSSVETGRDGAQIMIVVRFSLLCYLTHTFNFSAHINSYMCFCLFAFSHIGNCM